MQFKLDHIGYVTNDRKKFEKFWVDGLDFKLVHKGYVTPAKALALFGIYHGAHCFRYVHGNDAVEIHMFEKWIDQDDNSFRKWGINHACLHVESREDFLYSLVRKIGYFPIHRARDPRGWDNIFIQDFENNWIELRETI